MRRYLVLFLGAVMVAMTAYGGYFAAQAETQSHQPFPGRWLTEAYFIREQIAPQDMITAGRNNFKTVIDLRPDGEAPGQPSSTEMAELAKQERMVFHYIPVPLGPISDEAVAKLGAILRSAEGPVLLYCRSGARAARTWALVEASRPGGADAQAILLRVREAGFTADDLKDAITRRIAERSTAGK